MRLNELLLEKCEEFLELVVNEEKTPELTDAMGSLREFLENDVDGFTNLSHATLGGIVKSRLEEIWELISSDEKSANADLKDYYDEIIYEIETDESEEIGEDYLNEMDSQDLMYDEDE